MARIDREAALRWSARAVVALFVAGISVRFLLGELNGPLQDSYVLWWDPVGFACIIGMGAFGFARRVKHKRSQREAGNGQDGI